MHLHQKQQQNQKSSRKKHGCFLFFVKFTLDTIAKNYHSKIVPHKEKYEPRLLMVRIISKWLPFLDLNQRPPD